MGLLPGTDDQLVLPRVKGQLGVIHRALRFEPENPRLHLCHRQDRTGHRQPIGAQRLRRRCKGRLRFMAAPSPLCSAFFPLSHFNVKCQESSRGLDCHGTAGGQQPVSCAGVRYVETRCGFSQTGHVAAVYSAEAWLLGHLSAAMMVRMIVHQHES